MAKGTDSKNTKQTDCLGQKIEKRLFKNRITADTVFKFPDKRLCTWNSPVEGLNKIVGTQIHSILINTY